jgi:hypothetical protein
MGGGTAEAAAAIAQEIMKGASPHGDTGEEIVEVKIYARILARALDKVRAELARTH